MHEMLSKTTQILRLRRMFFKQLRRSSVLVLGRWLQKTRNSKLKHCWEFHHNREQALKDEIRKVKLKLAALRERFEKSLKEPDKVRKEFFDKVHRLHDKILAGKQNVQVEIEAHKLTRLNSEATLMELNAVKDDLSKFKEQQKVFAVNAAKVKQEKEELQAFHMTAGQHENTETSKMKKAVEMAVQPLEVKVARNMLERSKVGLAAVQEACKLKEELKRQSEEMHEWKENLVVLENVKADTKRKKERAENTNLWRSARRLPW
ncbi:hypothetical protein ACMFMG_006264 [Clarireedia jacksonii]